MSTRAEMISGTFIWRRVHSLMGLWLVIYLIEHLLVNSQAALWVGDDGIGFVRLVNSLESLPYLQVIEVVFIAIPLLIHGYWGGKRIMQARTNVRNTDGSAPSLSYGRNRAFTWQRLSSWILLVGILAHVVQMRFVQMPKKVQTEKGVEYVVQVKQDAGLEAVAERVQVSLVKDGEKVVATANSPGKAMLMMVRETFKSPLMAALYTVFVLAAAFHAFNGFWTSLITWGAVLSYRSQKAMIPVCVAGMALLVFLGLAAIWGSYWINLRN